MKKIIIGILIIVTMILGACSNKTTADDSDWTHNDANETSQNTEDSTPSQESPTQNQEIHTPSQDNPTQSQEDPSSFMPIDFYSYEDLKQFVNQANTETEHPTVSTDELLTFQAATNNVQNQLLPIPCLNSKAIVLKSSEEFPGITLFASELYLKPWIWYTTCINNQEITVRIMLDQAVMNTLDEDISCSDVIKLIAPNAPNVDNYLSFEGYSQVYEQQITTADGNKIALVQLEANRNVGYFSFVQNGFLVTLSGPQEVITSNWLNGFSILQNYTFDNEHLTE